MQCPACHFENLPGLQRCMRCNAALVLAAAIPTYPPRAGWRRHWRPLKYLITSINIPMPGMIGYRLERWMGRITLGLHHLLFMLLAVVPGLAHAVTGRLRAVRWFLLAWVTLLALYGLLLPTQFAPWVLGGLIGVHVWIIMDAGRIQDLFTKLGSRIVISILLFYIVNAGVYQALQDRWFRSIVSPATLPAAGIELGETLLLNPTAYAGGRIPHRGDVVLNMSGTNEAGATNVVIRTGETLAVVVGVGGDAVVVADGKVKLRSATGRTLEYESPLSLTDGTYTVPHGAIMAVPATFTINGHGVNLPQSDILAAVSITPLGNLRGRVTAVLHFPFRYQRVPDLIADEE